MASYCPDCGAFLSNSAVFCPNCGAQISGTQVTQQPIVLQPTEAEISPPRKKKSRLWLWILITALVLSAAGAGVYFFFGYGKNDENKDDGNKNAASEAAPADGKVEDKKDEEKATEPEKEDEKEDEQEPEKTTDATPDDETYGTLEDLFNSDDFQAFTTAMEDEDMSVSFKASGNTVIMTLQFKMDLTDEQIEAIKEKIEESDLVEEFNLNDFMEAVEEAGYTDVEYKFVALDKDGNEFYSEVLA